MAGRHSPYSTESEGSYHSAHGDEAWVHERNIGAGGFGVVKLYVNKFTGQKVVLKECRLMSLSRENIDRWYEELEILKQLDHGNIVKAQNLPEGLDTLTNITGTPFICMEYCDGGDLRQVLRDPENCCGLEEPQIRQICGDVNNGMRFLHSARVIHRDLKPENILLKRLPGDKVIYKLTDFGYAKRYDQSSVCTSLVGTMQYVAPEVLMNKPYHSSVDFWSFGVVVFECITGRRPFFHGDPAVAIGWVEFVARKEQRDIHIYWGDDDSKPVYSSTLPRPHRLSKPFEEQITSWLQIALQYNHEMRGGRKVASEDAPCVTNMDHILGTKVVNAVCTSTGQVYSLRLQDNMRVDALKKAIHTATSVAPGDQYLFLSDGVKPDLHQLASCCLPEEEASVGTVYVFTTAMEPSFQMVHNTNPVVQNFIAYGDEKIHYDDRREVYSQVFFHVREQYMFFRRLHQAHRAILTHITRQQTQVKQEQRNLISCHQRLTVLAGIVTGMYNGDYKTLTTLHDQRKHIAPSIAGRTLEKWRSCLAQLKEKTRSMHSMESEIARSKEEAESFMTLSDDLIKCHQDNEKNFKEYCTNYVEKARDIYCEAKANRGHVTIGQMHDVLLGATQDADTLILSRLNGLNFAQRFMVLGKLLDDLRGQSTHLRRLEREIEEINDNRRGDIWQLLDREHKSTPYSPMSPSNADPFQVALPPHALQRHSSHRSSSQGSNSGGDPGTYSRQPSQISTASSSSQRHSGQIFRSSSGSIELDVPESVVEESLQKLKRFVSVEENDKVLDRNKEVLTRLHSLVEFHRQESFNAREPTHPVVTNGSSAHSQ